MTKEDLVKKMIAEGVAEDKALALADEILTALVQVEVEPAAEMDADKPVDPSVPAADVDPMKVGDMSAEMKAKDAKIKALETQLVQANLRSLKPAIQRACDAVKVGVGADLQKVCDELASKAGTQHKGRDSQLFVEGMAHGLSVTGVQVQTPVPPVKTKAADTKPPPLVAPDAPVKVNDAKADPLAFS